MAAWKLAYHANCWGPLGGDAVGVTSITRLAYRTFGDMARAARDIAAAGYQGIEFFDGNVVEGEGDDYAASRTHPRRDRAELVAVYSGGNFIFPTSLTRSWRVSARRRRPPRRSAPSTWSSAAARGATTAPAKATTTHSLPHSTRCRHIAKARGLAGPLPSASVDDRRKSR